jgi:pilus assembly protein CpaB
LKRTNRLVLLIGVFLAVVAFVLIVILLGNGGGGGGTSQPTAPTVLKTVIAATDIPLGATIAEDMLTTQDLKVSERKPGAFENPGLIIGQVVRRNVTAGAQLEKADFVENINTLVVPPGQRAMAVQVDSVSGVGTVIKTGDYVDMVIGLTGDTFPVVTLNPDDQSVQVVNGLNGTSVKMLIEGMQVIGTIRQQTTSSSGNQQQQNQASPSAAPAQPVFNEDSQELVILSVSAQQSELIKYAQMQGQISLVLRSPQDFIDENGDPILPLPAGTTGVILKTLVDGYGVLRPELVEAILPAQ